MQSLKSTLQVYWNKPWLRRSVIGLGALLGLLILLPILIEYSLIHQLRRMGADRVSIEDIDLNLFNGTFGLSGFVLEVDDNPAARLDKLELDVGMLDVLTGRYTVENISVQGLNAELARRKNGELSINGFIIPQPQKTDTSEEPTSASPLPKFALLQVTVNSSRFMYRESEFAQQVEVANLSLVNLVSWKPETTARLDARLKVDNAPVILSFGINLFAEEPLLSGQFSVDSLALAPYHKFYRDHIDRLDSSVKLTASFDIVLGDSVQADLQTEIALAETHLEYRHLQHTTESLAWNGNIRLRPNGEYTVNGNLEVRDSHNKDTRHNYLLSSINALTIEQLNLDPQTLAVKKVSLDGLQFIDPGQTEGESGLPLLKLKQLQLQGLDYQIKPASVSMQQVDFGAPEIALHLDQQRQPEHLSLLQSTIDTFEDSRKSRDIAPEENQASDTSPMRIRMEGLKLKEPGSVDIIDNSVSPVFRTRLHLDDIEVSNLSSEDSAIFGAKAKLADYTSIDINGEGLLLSPTQELKLNAKITQLDLPPVTPYTSQAMGYGMKSGVVNSDIELSISQKELDSLIELRIDSIEVVQTDQNTAEQISSASGMSIDLAVSTLKDQNNVIDLKLPVKGNIDNPDFDLSLIINKAMGKAMKSATLTYLKHTLQPFGSLVTLFSLAKAAANHISLPPVLFETNSAEFKEGQQELLKKVGKVLNERPALKIKACGIAALTDLKEIETSLLQAEQARLKKENKPVGDIKIAEDAVLQKARDLADQRAARVKAYLLEKEGLKPERILNCLSSTRSDKESKAAVELQI